MEFFRPLGEREGEEPRIWNATSSHCAKARGRAPRGRVD